MIALPRNLRLFNLRNRRRIAEIDEELAPVRSAIAQIFMEERLNRTAALRRAADKATGKERKQLLVLAKKEGHRAWRQKVIIRRQEEKAIAARENKKVLSAEIKRLSR